MQQCVVNVDGSLELLQASGFELVFDESSPEPWAAAPSQGTDHVPLNETADIAQPPSDIQAGTLFSEVSRMCERFALSFVLAVRCHMERLSDTLHSEKCF